MAEISVEEIVDSLKLSDVERDEIADSIFAHKRNVYVETIDRLARGFRRKLDPSLGTAVTEALRGEALTMADSIVATYNRDAERFVSSRAGESLPDLLDAVEEWSLARGDWKGEQISVTETYGPFADATLAFFEAQGVRPEFDFGGAPDPAPVCAICDALVRGSPWSLGQAVEFGRPHVGCRQSWRPRGVSGPDLPRPLRPVERPAGVVGRATLLERSGGLRQAAEAVASVSR